jgi:GGDEF domain-containing protein
VPLAYYQWDGAGQIVATLVSDGLCRMMNADRDKLTSLLNGSLFDRIHPDDVERVARITGEFARHLCGYDVIYRGKYDPDGDYHYIHSVGSFQPTPDGGDLALIVYTDISDAQGESQLLVENYELFQKDHFYTDPVTGLPNGNYLHEFADGRVKRLRDGNRQAALFHFDVRGMRAYNAQYGYAKGDDLLRLVADVLKDHFPGAMIARSAEDHFVVITDSGDIQTWPGQSNRRTPASNPGPSATRWAYRPAYASTTGKRTPPSPWSGPVSPTGKSATT